MSERYDKKRKRREGNGATARRLPGAVAHAAALILLATLGADPGLAATFTVDRTDDAPGATTCDPAAPNDCSLRGAIIASNTLAGDDTISVPAGTYLLTAGPADPYGANPAVSGDLDLTGNVTIVGAGRDATVIDAAGMDRVFHIQGATVSISGVTIKGGSSPVGCVSDLQIACSAGGGICVKGGAVTVADSRITGNSGCQGAGSEIGGSLTLRRVSVDGNNGRGLQTNGGGTLLLENSSVTSNSDMGIMNVGNVTAVNTTISGNGIGLFNSYGPITLNNVTVAGNTTGVAGNAGAGTLNVSNSIIGGNTYDCSASQNIGINSGGYNLIQGTAPCTVTGDTTGNLLGVAAMLGPLQDNGGGTLTRALLLGSPAVDHGNPAVPGSGGTACTATDQRGIPRTICDIGAFEVTGAVPVGTGILAQPTDTTTGKTPVSITFANVTAEGTTSLTTTSTAPSPPAQFKLGSPPVYYEISTTASYTGAVTICIDYSGITFNNYGKIKLFHYENGSWSNVTTSLDTASHTVCGSVYSFSAFGVFEQAEVQAVCGNGVIEAGEQCDDGNIFDGDCCSSTCRFEAAGSVCADDGIVCTSDVCNGSGACIHPPGNAGMVCRAAAGLCDVAEVCDGATPQCPADAKSTAICRPSAGQCDAAEYCDGAFNECPPDGFKPVGSICQADSDNCTIDRCNAAGACLFSSYVTCGGKRAGICGTEGDDVLVGTNAPDVINGLGGNDKISGLNADDIICGGSGNDTIHGGNGNDLLYGDEGGDVLYGDNGNDVLNGGQGTDTCLGGPGRNTLNGCERTTGTP